MAVCPAACRPTPQVRTIQVYPKDLRALPVHPKPALSWPSGFRGGAHARPEATPVSHAARRRGGSVAARGAAFFRPSLHPVSESAYPTELFAGSPRGHCRPPALAMPITLMAAPSVITPRNANQLRKAKQLSGTATASNNSTFMAKCVCLWLRRPT
jgi:hypothetical protein